MADNKVVLADGTVLIDLTEDTVTPQTMVRGTTAHDASGESVTGVVDLAYAGDADPLQDGTASPGVSDNYSREDHVHPTDPSIAAKYTKPATGIPFTDLADDAKMVVLYYGKSTWADFEAVYHTNRVVYCRASSNSNPASGSQTRMAFMAYVNNEASPTEVEFQYYRSVASHTDSQQGDQVFVYKLNKNSGWSVTTRSAFTKIATGTGLSHTYSSGTLTITNTETVPGVVSKTADGLAPQLPDETTTTKFLRQDASWAEPVVTTVNGHTVQSDVPANAVFTDTTYSDATTSASGLMSAADKTKLNGLSSDAATVNGHTVASDVPANAVFTDTHRPIQVDGTQILGSNTTPLNLVAGTNITLTNSGGAVTIDASGGSGGSNPNLLNNWWFGEGLFHPSGQTPITADGYSGGLNIFGDAWHLRMGTVTKITTGSGDDSFTCWNIQLGGGQGNPGQFIQFLQNPLPPYPNGPYTLSVIAYYDNTPPCVLGVFVDDVLRDGVPVYGEQGFNLYQYTFDAPASFASHTIAVGLQKDIRYGQDASVHVLAMKLEVGTESTLAVQNAYGEWVLNDAPNNKLSLYGGIMTGRLRIQTTKSDSLGKNVLTLQNMNLSSSTAPSSDTIPLRIGFYDQNTSSYGFIGSEHLANGKYGLHMMATGPNTTNSLKLLVDSSNNRTVEVSDSAAWRTALGVVNKAGDTMTGGLYVSKDNPGFYARATSTTSGETSSTETNHVGFRVIDKDDSIIAVMTDYYTADNRQGAWLAGGRIVNGATVYNSLNLYVAADGTKSVTVSSPQAWRTAIGAVNKAGDTTTGTLTYEPAASVRYVDGATGSGSALYVKKRALDTMAYNPAVVMQTKSGGSWAIHNYTDDKLEFAFVSKANIDSGTNVANVYSIDTNGNYSGSAANVTGVVAIANGGTGSSTKNFVDLSTDQSIAGLKTFTNYIMIDRSATTLSADAVPSILVFKYKNPQGYVKTVNVVRTYADTEAGSNNGCVLIGSNSGTTVVSAGESAAEVVKAQAISSTENVYIVADGAISLWTGGNQSTGAVTKAVTISSGGNATFVAIPYVSGTSPGYIGKYTNMTDTTAPSSNTNCIGFRIRDKNDANIALYTDYWGSNGSQGVMISGYRNGVANALYMLVTSSGERYVSVSSPAAWRTALGLGTVATQSTVAIANGGTGKTTAAEANAALGAKYWKNSSAITSSQSRTLTFSAAVRCVLYLVNTVTGNSGEYLVYCGGATSTPVITTVKAASNVTLTAAAGKITFTSTHTSNQYVYAMNLTNNPGSMTFA